MPSEVQLSGVLSEFAGTMLTDFPIQEILDRLVVRIVDILPVSAAGVTLITPGLLPRYVAASSDLAMRFEQMQTDLGEGPWVLANATGRAVTVPDLRTERRFARFGPEALEGGLVAVFTFPLCDGDARLGALDLYRDEPGALDDDTLVAAQTLADVAAAYLLNAQARAELQASTDQAGQSEAKHRRLAEQLAAAQRVAGIGSWEWDVTTDTLSWSDELCRIFGIEPDQRPRTFDGYLSAFHPDDRDLTDAAIRKAAATGESFSFDHRVILPDGTIRLLRARGDVTRDDAGGAVRLTGTSQDVTDVEQTVDALRTSESRLAEAQSIARLGSWDWDIAADHVTWSEELCRLFGVEAADIVPTYPGYLLHIHPDDRVTAESAINAALHSGGGFAFDHRVVRPDGTVTWVHSRGQVDRDDRGTSTYLRGTAIDITDRVELQQELAEEALVDDLTGLHNRRGFISLADHLCKVAQRAGLAVPLLFIDMDGMKAINDSYGHNVGDRALVEVATFLRGTLRSSDVIARVGGDEFCILIDQKTSSTKDAVDRVVATLRRGLPRQGAYPLALSVGVAWLEPRTDGSVSVEELMRRADRAMYEDKKSRHRLARVLVVEDDASLRDLAAQTLDERYDIVLAATGAAALAILVEQLPDLILLDLGLEDMPGTDVLRILRELPGGDRVPVIVITGSQQQNAELESLEQGADDFVGKPFDFAVLEARMNNALHRSSTSPRPSGG